jgi:hypothetical protein
MGIMVHFKGPQKYPSLNTWNKFWGFCLVDCSCFGQFCSCRSVLSWFLETGLCYVAQAGLKLTLFLPLLGLQECTTMPDLE